MISIDDLAYISNELCENDDKPDDDLVYDNDIERNESDAYVLQDQNESLKSEEQSLRNNPFIHGKSFSSDCDQNLKFMELALTIESIQNFRVIRLDTCCNKSSIRSYDQYKAYCMEFQVLFKVSRVSIKTISAIGGSQEAIVAAKLPIPFKDLNIIIDVTFHILRYYVPSLFIMSYMYENDLEIRIQKK